MYTCSLVRVQRGLRLLLIYIYIYIYIYMYTQEDFSIIRNSSYRVIIILSFNLICTTIIYTWDGIYASFH